VTAVSEKLKMVMVGELWICTPVRQKPEAKRSNKIVFVHKIDEY